MSRRNQVPSHRRTGAQLDPRGTIRVAMCCLECGATEDVRCSPELTVDDLEKDSDCLFCGRTGRMVRESRRAAV